MELYEFKAYLDHPPTSDDYEKLFAAGLTDTLPGVESGRGVLDVARRATSSQAAIVSVGRDAARAGFAVVAIETIPGTCNLFESGRTPVMALREHRAQKAKPAQRRPLAATS